MTQPTVAILTPSFNREDLVAETLDSILAQTYPHWENIVVDDGSTDGTKAVVAAYAARDPRIRVFDRSRDPKGACTCRNQGVELTSADYVMFLDTDDILEPFCLEQRVAAMEARPELDFAIFPSLMFDKVPHDLGLWWNVDKPDEDELSRQFRQDAICQGTGVLWRKDAFERLGMWDEQLLLWQDIELFLRAYIRGFRYAKFFDLPPDLHNRVNHASLSRRAFFTPEKMQSRARVVRRAVELLKENGLDQRVREARFMLAEIVSGAARSGQSSIAGELIEWGEAQGVLSRAESAELRRLSWLYRTRAARLPGLRNLSRVTERRFSAPSTLGRIPRGTMSERNTAGDNHGGH
jgi:glycosyltransferase involved in cell wall biosynthesis